MKDLKYKIIPNTTNAVMYRPISNEHDEILVEFEPIVGWKVEYTEEYGGEMASPVTFNSVSETLAGIYYPDYDSWIVGGESGITGEGKDKMMNIIKEEYKKYWNDRK